MLFRNEASGVLAISQPAHAWISGQLCAPGTSGSASRCYWRRSSMTSRWLDWETAPSFDAETGRPHIFRAIGAAEHAPMWARGVRAPMPPWGAHVALLISLHGGVIYRRYTDRHRISAADAAAAQNYLDTQGPIEAAWAQALGLDDDEVERQRSLVAFADALSLALCGDLKTPLKLEARRRSGDRTQMQPRGVPGRAFEFVLDPWPFAVDPLVLEGEARGFRQKAASSAKPLCAPGSLGPNDRRFARKFAGAPERSRSLRKRHAGSKCRASPSFENARSQIRRSPAIVAASPDSVRASRPSARYPR